MTADGGQVARRRAACPLFRNARDAYREGVRADEAITDKLGYNEVG